MRLALPAFALAFVLPVACGGAPKPADTGTDPQSALAGSSAPPPPSGPSVPEPPPSAEVDQGMKAFESGDLVTAQKSFEAAIAKNPKNYIAIFNLGQTHEKAGRKAEAENAYKRALDVKPDLVEAAVQLAALYLDAAPPRLDDTIALCRGVIARSPQAPALHNDLAIALASKGVDQDTAIQEFTTAVSQNPKEPMFHLSFAQWLNAWKIKGAVPHLDAARELAPKDDIAMLASIGHEYRMAAAFTECVAHYDKLIAKKETGEFLTERALCKRGLKQDDAALADLKQAASKNDYPAAHVYYGLRLQANKKYKEAIAEFLKSSPDSPGAKDVQAHLQEAKDLLAGKKKGP
jgi:tetratricopeptide (TPR) repeat protein